MSTAGIDRIQIILRSHAVLLFLQKQTYAPGSIGFEKKIDGKENAETLKSANNLTEALAGQRKHLEAEPTHRATLVLRAEALGRRHLERMESVSNLTARRQQGFLFA